MSRYDIAKRQFKKQVLRFPPARKVATIIRYIQQCIEQSSDMDISNLSISAVEQAVINIAGGMHSAVLVADQNQAKVMRIVYRYSEVYTKKDLPEGNFVLILGDIDCPETSKVVVRLFNRG